MKPHAAAEKDFDCVEMKNRIQSEIAAETEGMSPMERLAYYKRLTAEGPFAHLFSQGAAKSRKKAS